VFPGSAGVSTYLFKQSSWSLLALKPSTEKTTMLAKMDVLQLMIDTIMASRRQLFLGGL